MAFVQEKPPCLVQEFFAQHTVSNIHERAKITTELYKHLSHGFFLFLSRNQKPMVSLEDNLVCDIHKQLFHNLLAKIATKLCKHLSNGFFSFLAEKIRAYVVSYGSPIRHSGM